MATNVDAERIQKEGVKLLEEFSTALEGIPDTAETHYVVDVKNVWRKDNKPVECKGFPDKFKKLAPKVDDDFIVAEKAP
ncbi:Uncharacterised protein [uncultured archaeon]|nr:Uncharacterised protein [uncultured archaeon]